MGSLHWLILIPYYFFTAITAYLSFALVCRLARASVSANPLAMAAMVTSIAATALPILTGWIPLASYSWQGLVVLLVLSGTLALLDAILKGGMPLPLDEELEDV